MKVLTILLLHPVQLGSLGDSRGMMNLFARFDWNDLPSQFDNRFGLHFSPSVWLDNGANFTIDYNTAEPLAYIEDLYECVPSHRAPQRVR
mgnify:FL=1